MDGGMNEISNMMIRQRELLTESLNDTNTGDDRDKLQMETGQLL
jgi:flagellin-like hook-associated protein FlgL